MAGSSRPSECRGDSDDCLYPDTDTAFWFEEAAGVTTGNKCSLRQRRERRVLSKRLKKCISCSSPQDTTRSKIYCLRCIEKIRISYRGRKKRGPQIGTGGGVVVCVILHRRTVEAELEGDAESIVADGTVAHMLRRDCGGSRDNNERI